MKRGKKKESRKIKENIKGRNERNQMENERKERIQKEENEKRERKKVGILKKTVKVERKEIRRKSKEK